MSQGDSHLGFITGSTLFFWFMHSVVNLFKDDHNHRFTADYLMVHGPYVHANRNRLQSEFMEGGREWLFMVDNDMVFEPGDVWELLRVAELDGPGVYSAPYLIENGVMVCGVWDNEIEKVYHPLNMLPAEPTPIGVVGAGFTLIHREVFEATGENAFTGLNWDSGEDVSFSWRAREAGFTPILVPSSKPGHHKSLVLYPSAQVRNMVGEEVNLVEVDGDKETYTTPLEVR